MLITNKDPDHEISAFDLGMDGTGSSLITLRQAGNPYFWQDGQKVFKFAVIFSKCFRNYLVNIDFIISKYHQKQMSCVPFSGPLGTATLVGNSYSYDKANRLTMSDFGYYYTPDSTWHTTPAYDANYAYDNVGNFTTLQRYGSTGSVQDNLTYTYTQGTNRLSSINGSLAVYNYDSNGNVKYDSHRGIGFMIYDPDNLPVTAYLTNGEQLIYENDVNGNRVRNTISGSSDNYYFNGADGKTEAVALLPLSNVTYNILGAGGDNIGQLRVINSNPARYYYLKDHLSQRLTGRQYKDYLSTTIY